MDNRVGDARIDTYWKLLSIIFHSEHLLRLGCVFSMMNSVLGESRKRIEDISGIEKVCLCFRFRFELESFFTGLFLH